MPRARMPLSTRAQIVGQIFIYVLGIVIMAAILVYGYNAVTEFRQKSSQVSTIKLQSDLSSAIDILSSEYGSVKKKTLQMEDYSQICFVESYGGPPSPGAMSGADPILRDSVLTPTGKNVFLLKNTVEASFTVNPISVNPDVLCIEARAKTVDLRLEGKGDHVSISPWQD